MARRSPSAIGRALRLRTRPNSASNTVSLRRFYEGRPDSELSERIRIRDPGVRELVSKVNARVAPGIEARYPREWPAKVTVRLANGGALEAETTHPKGDPEFPLSPAEIESKFRSLAAYGRRASEAESLLDWVRGLASEKRVRLPK